MTIEGRIEQMESGARWALQNEAVEAILQTKSGEKIELDDFENEYGKEEIEKDKRTVEGARARIIQNPERAQKKKWADALEIVIHKQISKDEWFGEKAVVAPISEYDDFINNVDFVVEFYTDDESGEAIALSIDASMGTETLPPKNKSSEEYESATEKKVAANIKKILGQIEPAQIKYFESQITGRRGKAEKIIPAVVGLEGKNAGELFRLFLAIIESGKASHLPEGHLEAKRRELRMHPAQMVFLSEIREQLTMYERLLKNNPPGPYKVAHIARVKTIIDEVIASKKEAVRIGELKNDEVFRLITAASSK